MTQLTASHAYGVVMSALFVAPHNATAAINNSKRVLFVNARNILCLEEGVEYLCKAFRV